MSNLPILVVEDDHDARVALRSLLEDRGYTVVSATNGNQALALLAEMTKPALIVLDLAMPLMDGSKLLAILSESADYRDIPVVVVSAHQLDARLKPGTLAIIPKPIPADRLLATVDQIYALPAATVG